MAFTPRLMLTKVQIEEAKEQRSHVAIKALDEVGTEHWRALTEALRDGQGNPGRMCHEAFIPFAEIMEGQTFTLKPVEIVSIWARAVELFQGLSSPGYRLAESLTCAYGAIPIVSHEWEHLFSGLAQNGKELRDLARGDRSNARLFLSQLVEINHSLEELRHYLNGTEMDLVPIVVAASKGNRQAKRTLEAINASAHEDPLLDCVVENWGNGFEAIRVLAARGLRD